MSVSESERCEASLVELRAEGRTEVVDERVWNHMPAVGQDELGIWAVRCFSCGELMLGRPEHRLELIHQLQRQITALGS